ncbi:MAG: tetratricopeptide repeat protein [Bryobacterales bacterium]|nr:tetratricopeptide repeat protein [Bryobacteraceae bacterium]MDW8355057.1 tetratricopeptide repeat protein [Bryobacterales bacterium]
MRSARGVSFVGAGLIVLLLNSAYLWGFATPSVFYMANVLAHIVLGAALTAAVAWLLIRRPEWRREARLATVLLGVSAALGFYLTWAGALRPNRWILWAHIGLAIAGLVALLRYALSKALGGGRGWRWFARGLQFSLVLLVALRAGTYTKERFWPAYPREIRNPLVVPTSMEEEGLGPKSPLWPSSAKTTTGELIPSDFFLDSHVCGECHKDIYEQWLSSAHRFSSFNNQFYRKSIEYMQSIVGTKPSRWCAGCHDHAMFFNGRFDIPAVKQLDTPEAHAGLACVSCHSIVHVEGTMGNGGFTLMYPPLHHLAVSENRVIRWLDRFLTNVDPEPHRRTFMKPFMRSSAEFCSACHKVHLDVPVNNYRWFRGFNDYDSWQASGVSGQGARSFYYPPQAKTCSDCHMPLVPSRDPGNINGFVHSHRFPAANTALAYVNKDHKQMQVTQEFLQSGFITMDIFAAWPYEEIPGAVRMLRRAEEGPRLMSSFAVGEEAEQSGELYIREVGRLAAPIDKAGAKFQPGSAIGLDVVVRTRGIGHFFPGGTVDAFDVWLEVQARDATGRIIFWSGMVEDGGKGPVEKGAHFYRSYMLDAAGNPINKRNAWQARSVLYVRLIPPGAADVAHYILRIPRDAKGPITVTAKLNHRKFSHYYTQFSYAGEPAPGQPATLVSANHDSRIFTFSPTNIPKNVSGLIKDHIPDLPITTIAQATAKLELAGPGEATVWRPVVHKQDWERWNDWGIGLLLQGDLKGAEYAFLRVTEADPNYADGWLNVARALIQEGQTEAAKPFIERALRINPKLGRIHFFKAMIQKAEGDYDGALASLRTVAALYPRDRVVLNQMGRVLFLKRDYKAAVEAFQRVLAVDPEDVQAHYNLMLCYRGLGEWEKAKRAEKLFLRFKADESAQSITQKPRLLSPEDNNERQRIHFHESVPLERIAARISD